MTELVNQTKGTDVLGNRTTIVQLVSELKKLELYNYLEEKFPNKDFYVDWMNPYDTEDKMYQVVFVGNVKVKL